MEIKTLGFFGQFLNLRMMQIAIGHGQIRFNYVFCRKLQGNSRTRGYRCRSLEILDTVIRPFQSVLAGGHFRLLKVVR